ncbi:TPA: YadA family autotransporter adhesin [Pasteurella multocida]|nr:YadA family autotransporter adhesin [Pasteurella multocida]
MQDVANNVKKTNGDVSSLQSGLSGVVVYTHNGKLVAKQGKEFYDLEAAKDTTYIDGKGLFKNTDLKDDGTPKDTAQPVTPLDKANIELSLVNPDGSVTTPTVLNNIAEGKNDNDAVNVKQLNNAKTTVSAADDSVTVTSKFEEGKGTDYKVGLSQKTKDTLAKVGTGQVVKGDQNTVTGDTVYNALSKVGGGIKHISIEEQDQANPHVAVGEGAAENIGKNATAVGNKAAALAENSSVLGTNAKVMPQARGAVALGYGSVASEPNTVSVGSVGNERRITNVAPGVKGTDAVNVNQLKQVETKLERTTRDLQAGIASAAALGFLQRPDLPGKSMVSIATGGHKGEHAIAVGYAKNTDNHNISIKLGVSVNTRKDLTWASSVGYQW